MKVQRTVRRISGFTFLGPLVLFAFFGGLFYWLPEVAAFEQSQGLRVYLPRECGGDDRYDNRVVVLQILGKGKFRINETDISEAALAERMSTIYESRQERVLRVVVKDGASYGDLVVGIDRVRGSVPKLTVLLVDQRIPNAVWNACISSKQLEPDDRGY